MADPRYKFKRFDQRNDIGDIKSRCYETSAQATDQKTRSMTTYRHDYIRHPIDYNPKATAPPEGIYIGGGCLAPTREEMRSNYQNYFKKLDLSDRPQTAQPMPESKLFQYDFPTPLSTTQAANNEVVGKTPKYDNTDARRRITENTAAHFVLGSDGSNYETDYQHHFKNFRGEKPSTVDNRLQKSSITFDKDAGYGPHTRSLSKREKFPGKPDIEKPNHLKVNYDIGYAKTPYVTTNQDFARDPRYFHREAPVKAPQCAQLSDHGEYAPKWTTTYNHDYDGRRRIPNDIDREDLKKTHWDQGHDPSDWRRKKYATTNMKPKKEFIDLQNSNVVFKGDGTMTFHTTQNDLVGVYDRNGECRCTDDITDSRADHLYLGGDRNNYDTTAKDANRLAGTGRPAQMCDDLHLKKGVGFARGGTYDPLATDDNVSEKPYKRFDQPKGMDGSYFTRTHFDLDATRNHNSQYETTYFETICRPKIASINYDAK